MSSNSDEVDRPDPNFPNPNSSPEPCERCGTDIHPLEPATSMKFSGGVDTETLLVCHGCVKEIIEWWNEGEAAQEDDSDE